MALYLNPDGAIVTVDKEVKKEDGASETITTYYDLEMPRFVEIVTAAVVREFDPPVPTTALDVQLSMAYQRGQTDMRKQAAEACMHLADEERVRQCRIRTSVPL